jgi:hypothetical protein
MASTGKKKTTMAKLARESRLRERRVEKAARKDARKRAAAHPPLQPDDPANGSEQWDDSIPTADSADDALVAPAATHRELGASPQTRD